VIAMKSLVEVHMLQHFAPSNLNRDDTGSPKDAIFGGYRRARISSQCLKRAARNYMRNNKLLDGSELALRTKRLVGQVAKELRERHGFTELEAYGVARTVEPVAQTHKP